MKLPIIKNEEVCLPLLQDKGVSLFVKREDTIHTYISGNKYRKLKYNVLEAFRLKKCCLLTFGGAYSNHIAAVAAAGKIYGFSTVGVIRGQELGDKTDNNPTLRYARDCGMHLEFVSREAYRRKNDPDFQKELLTRFDNCYLIPEGGTNSLAVKGCEEIVTGKDAEFDYITACVGTGGTLAGLINSSKENQKVLGFPALKGDFLKEDIRKFASKENWQLIKGYEYGGYARVTRELISGMNAFYAETGILTDPVYTGKMIMGVLDLLKKGYFKKGSRILAIHTGGLQGIAGMNVKLEQSNMPLINI
ncbi:1-aminocyclopropane-1-carboxylate deaminase/D-cysteine desulfhydrase [Ascidiimonas aurantiaca]|uniref:1-aminocyclopropane-1-carboxylate deaminase/D-cysteine desulfhydrase n=1 Tax=Ascidiimonas aurantiaca TaxID=1685432 RepID=UPI0030EC85F2